MLWRIFAVVWNVELKLWKIKKGGADFLVFRSPSSFYLMELSFYVVGIISYYVSEFAAVFDVGAFEDHSFEAE